MSITRIHINRDILIWAVERIGKTADEYALENPKFQQWLEGTKLPTFKNIEQFAQKFHVPLGYMFLANPPKEVFPIPFFRNHVDRYHNINVYDTIIEMQERQSWLSAYLRKMNFEEIDFVGTFSIKNDIQEACNKIRDILQVPHNWAFDYRNVDDALKYITRKMEDKGIIVSYNGVVGFNNSRPIPVADCRGFTLVDNYAPFIFINSKDAKVAQMFTLIHEFAHVLTGYSAGLGEMNMEHASDLEQFCDKVAAYFLVPDLLFREAWATVGERYDVLSKRFKVSRFVLARRAMDLGFINRERFFWLYNRWNNEPPIKTNERQGGNFYPSAIKKSSRSFLIHVNNALNRNMLLHMDAYRLTGLKGDTFHKIINSPFFI